MTIALAGNCLLMLGGRLGLPFGAFNGADDEPVRSWLWWLLNCELSDADDDVELATEITEVLWLATSVPREPTSAENRLWNCAELPLLIINDGSRSLECIELVLFFSIKNSSSSIWNISENYSEQKPSFTQTTNQIHVRHRNLTNVALAILGRPPLFFILGDDC